MIKKGKWKWKTKLALFFNKILWQKPHSSSGFLHGILHHPLLVTTIAAGTHSSMGPTLLPPTPDSSIFSQLGQFHTPVLLLPALCRSSDQFIPHLPASPSSALESPVSHCLHSIYHQGPPHWAFCLQPLPACPSQMASSSAYLGWL